MAEDQSTRRAGPVTPWARLAAWVVRLAEHRYGAGVLFVLAILEACVFPAPTEAVFLALGVGRPRRSWRLAAIATAGSLVGAGLGYLIGASFFASVGQPLLVWAGLLGGFEQVGRLYRDNLYVALLTSGYTPIPYVLYTIAAGAYEIPLLPFLGASLAGRGLKYVLLSLLTYYIGPVVRAALGRAAGWALAAGMIVLAGWWLIGR